MTRVANIAVLLFWSGLALIAFDQFGYTAAGITLMSGWLVTLISEAAKR